MVGKRFIFFGFFPIVGIQIAQRFFISDFFLPSWIRLQTSRIENRLRSVANAIHGGQAFRPSQSVANAVQLHGGQVHPVFGFFESLFL